MHADRTSATAQLVAWGQLLAAGDPGHCRLLSAGDVHCLERVLRRCPSANWLGRAVRHPALSRALWRLERLVLPGILLHYLARKRWIERAVVRQLQLGVRQVVVLGGGFDLLAWRLHREWPDVLFCELDHPATQHGKSAALSAARNLVFRPIDFTETLPSAALRVEPRFDPTATTCCVAEGVLMYFTVERVDELLHDIAGLATSLVFSFMTPDSDGRAGFRGGSRFIDAWLRLVREPFAWGLTRAGSADFLHAHGWRLVMVAGAAELRAEILAPHGLADRALAEGECLGLAASHTRDENSASGQTRQRRPRAA